MASECSDFLVTSFLSNVPVSIMVNGNLSLALLANSFLSAPGGPTMKTRFTKLEEKFKLVRNWIELNISLHTSWVG